MRQRRSRLETVSDILRLSIDEVKKTHIMYRANLSHQQLVKYLKLLLSNQLLAKTLDSYVTTPRGVEFLKKFEEIQALLDESNNARIMIELAR